LALSWAALWIATAGAQAPPRLGEIAGTVVDPQGAVIAGAQITAVNESTGKQYLNKTDAEGFFRIDLPAPGNYRIRFESRGFTSQTRTAIGIRPNQATPLDIKLEVAQVQMTFSGPGVREAIPVIAAGAGPLILNLPNGAIVGKVVDPLGVAVPGFRVRVINQSGNSFLATTDCDGTYRMSDLATGIYSVRFEVEGLETETKAPVRIRRSRVTRVDASLGVGSNTEGDSEAGNVDLNAEPAQYAGTIAGVVTDPAGAVIYRAQVNVTSASGARYATATDSSGSYRLSGLAPGGYCVSFQAAGFKSEIMTQVQVGPSRWLREVSMQLDLDISPAVASQ
jgi:hypothetical protein